MMEGLFIINEKGDLGFYLLCLPKIILKNIDENLGEIMKGQNTLAKRLVDELSENKLNLF